MTCSALPHLDSTVIDSLFVSAHRREQALIRSPRKRVLGQGFWRRIWLVCLCAACSVSRGTAQSNDPLPMGPSNQQVQPTAEMASRLFLAAAPALRKPTESWIQPQASSASARFDDFQMSQKCADDSLDRKPCQPHWGLVLGRQQSDLFCEESSAASREKPGEDFKGQPPDERLRSSEPADLNRDIYYKNKLEFSLDGGWLPINIPWPFDVFAGDTYDVTGVNYTLVPIIASLRWHLDDVGSPWILRGNWDMTFSASVTAIPRGPETRYFAYIMGIRRNFVQPRWKTVPYFNMLLGLGDIDAKGPYGVYGAQGQNFTFTFNLGSGVRYNFNPRYAISAGINYMHISNFYLSQPKFINYGINVYGPMVGIDIQLHPHRRRSEQ